MPGRPTNEADNYFAFGKQTAKDTEATTFYFVKHLDGTGIDFDTSVESEREGGDAQEVGLRYKSAIAMDGQAVANARPEVAARLFAYALGADAPTAPAGATVTHTNDHIAIPTALGSAAAYLTVEQKYTDIIERVSNAQVTRLTVEGEAGRPIKLTSELIGGGTPYRRSAAASSLTPTRESGQPFFYPGGSYVIDGAGNTKITKFKAEVRRGVDADIRTTQLFREDVVALNFETDLEFTLKYEDNTLWDKIHYGAGTVVPIDLATGSFKALSEFGTGTSSRELEVNFPVYDYTAVRVNRLDPDGKTVYLDVTAMGRKTATHQVFTRVQIASTAAF
ncbi:MAG: phage tail tube protein [Thermoanaerobaculia bacterium]